jgi:hypothetical protein
MTLLHCAWSRDVLFVGVVWLLVPSWPQDRVRIPYALMLTDTAGGLLKEAVDDLEWPGSHCCFS